LGAKNEIKLRKLLSLENKIYTRLRKEKQLLCNWWITRRLFTKLEWKILNAITNYQNYIYHSG
jgi:hypothetical protein